jgi:putative tryptophan/tyrosine transport system substrate-binding protein
MRRRNLILSLLAVASIAGSRAEQSRKIHRIAIVSPFAELELPAEARAFFEELQRLGYVEGRNMLVERYSVKEGVLHDPELARDVVRRRPDVIFAISNPLALDLKAATNTIPIVAMTADPIALGIVPSLAHPGGNITGVSVDAGLEIWGKRLEVLREATGASTIGFLASPIAWDRYVPVLRDAAARLAVSIIGPPLQPPFTDLEYRRVLAAMREKDVQALIASDLPANLSHRELIVELADRNQLPVIYPFREFVEIGGLIAYGFDVADIWAIARTKSTRF